MSLAVHTKRFRFTGILLSGCVLLLAWPSLAGLDTIAGLFGAGQYEEARAALAAGQDGARPGEEILWQSRLATDPAVAVSLLAGAAGESRFPPEVRIRIALETAELQAGRGDHAAAVAALRPLLDEDDMVIPGALYLRAGLSLRALGQLQQAREMLASVKPDSPSFVLARYYLGDIGLEQNDPALALRYFESAEKSATAEQRSRIAAGSWLALQTAGEMERAAELVTRLQKADPGSLALLEIQRLIQIEADEESARTQDTIAAKETEQTRPTAGRYSLQIGAFSDRGLAMEFMKRYQQELPDLRIDRSRDARGQYLYKVRLGEYVNPALARAEARKLEDRLNIQVIAAELGPAAGGTPNQ